MIKILEFQNDYRWLSNFAPCTINFDDVDYPSVEHAYQAAKSRDKEWRRFCQNEPRAGVVKRKSKNIQLHRDWHEIKVMLMADFLAQKFNQEPHKSLLLRTGVAYIQEGNHWGDKFWGVCLKTNEGKNTLGVLIMAIRANIVRTIYETCS